MYVHPVVAPQAWHELAGVDVGCGFVVVNPASGPGTAVEVAYADAVRAVAGTPSGAALVGYVDAAYGERPDDDVVGDLGRWVAGYGVDALFVDRVPALPAEVGRTVRLLDRLRRAGARRLVLNPGAVPPPQLVAEADVVVTFEGPWTAYGRDDPPEWLRGFAPERLCHLVHGVPPDRTWDQVVRRAEALGAGIVGASRGLMPNPWTGPLAGVPRRPAAA